MEIWRWRSYAKSVILRSPTPISITTLVWWPPIMFAIEWRINIRNFPITFGRSSIIGECYCSTIPGYISSSVTPLTEKLTQQIWSIMNAKPVDTPYPPRKYTSSILYSNPLALINRLRCCASSRADNVLHHLGLWLSTIILRAKKWEFLDIVTNCHLWESP